MALTGEGGGCQAVTSTKGTYKKAIIKCHGSGRGKIKNISGNLNVFNKTQRVKQTFIMEIMVLLHGNL